MSRYALSSPCYGPRPADILSVALTVDYAHRICQLLLSSPQQGLRSDMRSVALTMDYVHQTRPQLALTGSWEGNNTVQRKEGEAIFRPTQSTGQCPILSRLRILRKRNLSVVSEVTFRGKKESQHL